MTSWQIDWKKVETVASCIFLGSKITANVDCSREIRRCLLLGRKAMTNQVCGCLVAQSCQTLCSPIDGSPLDSSVHGVLQARILGWISVSFSRGSSLPKDQTWVSCIAGRFFTIWVTREAHVYIYTHTHTHTHKYIHKNIHMHIYTHIYIFFFIFPSIMVYCRILNMVPWAVQ